MIGSAVSQIQIDETLVRNAGILRDRLEVADGFFVQSNRDLLFKLGRIRIFLRGSEIIFFAHGSPFRGRTWIHGRLPID